MSCGILTLPRHWAPTDAGRTKQTSSARGMGTRLVIDVIVEVLTNVDELAYEQLQRSLDHSIAGAGAPAASRES